MTTYKVLLVDDEEEVMNMQLNKELIGRRIGI